MCWNARTSFVTLGVGTATNLAAYAILREDTIAQRFVLAWQYGLLMQIPEGIAWLSLEDEGALRAASFTAMLLNVTQPLVFWLSTRAGVVGAHRLPDPPGRGGPGFGTPPSHPRRAATTWTSSTGTPRAAACVLASWCAVRLPGPLLKSSTSRSSP